MSMAPLYLKAWLRGQQKYAFFNMCERETKRSAKPERIVKFKC
jgi:hypothetical protein